MTGDRVEKGDKVSWQWGGGAPSGVVEETKTEGEIAIESNKGNTIKKNADPENPAVHIGREGNDVVKKTSELTVLGKNVNGESSKEDSKEESKAESKEKSQPEEPQKNSDTKAQAGEKRDRVADGEPEKGDEKKLKIDPVSEQNGEASAAKEAEPEKVQEPKEDAKEDADAEKKEKKRGRPKGAPLKPKKAPKERPPPATEGIGSRTRSRAK